VLRGGGWVDLAQAIQAVLRGEFYVSHGLTTAAGATNGTASSPDPKVLTARQTEVLKLMTDGMPTREIAERLFISTKTVESHRAQIMDRLNIGTLAGLVKFAIREGFTSLGR
jgi:DNA-binding NarL/FixJ family response regulator